MSCCLPVCLEISYMLMDDFLLCCIYIMNILCTWMLSHRSGWYICFPTRSISKLLRQVSPSSICSISNMGTVPPPPGEITTVVSPSYCSQELLFLTWALVISPYLQFPFTNWKPRTITLRIVYNRCLRSVFIYFFRNLLWYQHEIELASGLRSKAQEADLGLLGKSFEGYYI